MAETKKGSKTASKENLDKKNTNATIQKVVSRRELKYIYPRGMTDTLKRKAYRQKIRNTLHKLERDMAKLKGQEKKDKKAEMATFQGKHLANA